MIECCKYCKYLKELWYWEDYPRNKKRGFCCNLLDCMGDNIIMQLYNIEDDVCECFECKNK